MSIEFRVYRQAVAIIRDYASTILEYRLRREPGNLVTHLRRRRPYRRPLL